MAIPRFTCDEHNLINYVKSPTASRSSSDSMLGYVRGAILLAAVGVCYNSVAVMAAAVVILIDRCIYQEKSQKRWTPLWQNVIETYDAARKIVFPPVVSHHSVRHR